MKLFQAFLRDETGVTAIEYGLIASLVSVAIIASLTQVGINLNNLFLRIAAALAIRP